jgi:hypothetical protein
MQRTRAIIAIAWILFWILMVSTSVQEYLRDHDHGIWKPMLWETSSALVGTFYCWRSGASRAYDVLIANAHALVPAPAGVAAGVLGDVRAGGLRHPPCGVCADGRDLSARRLVKVYLYEDIKMTVFFSIFVAITFGVLSFHAMLEEKCAWSGHTPRCARRSCCGLASRCSRTSCSMH